MSTSRVHPVIAAVAGLALLLAAAGLYVASQTGARHADQRSRLATLDDLRQANVITPDEYRRQAQRLADPPTAVRRDDPKPVASSR